MGTQDILGYLKEQPFRPFRIHMVNGRTFDIRHPEMVRVSRTSVVIFTFVSDNPDVFDHWDTIALNLVMHVTHLDAPAPA